MVYQTYSQLKRYHVRPEPFLTTHDHFYDSPDYMEAPDPNTRTTHHKSSTFAKLYEGAPHHQQQRMSKTSKLPMGKMTNLTLFPAPLAHTRTIPSSTYQGNGNFTVELPHSTITYRSLRLVPYSQLSWKSEYGDQFTRKQAMSRGTGFSVLATRTWSHATR